MARCITLFVQVFVFILGSALTVYSDDFYLLPEVVGTSNTPRLGSFITGLSENGAPAGDPLLSVPLSIPLSKPSIIPASTMRELLSDAHFQDFVLVGNYTLFVPRAYRGEKGKNSEKWLALLRGIAVHEKNNSRWIEVDIKDKDNTIFEDMTFDVSTLSPGDESGTYTVNLKGPSNDRSTLSVTPYMRAWETKTALQPGVEIDPVDFVPRYVPAGEAAKYLGALPRGGGIVSAGYIASGSLLEKGDVKKEDIIRSGERVTILVRRNPISMKLEGIAYGSGGKGDKIRVKPVHSNKSFYAQVVSSREVRVEDL